MRVEEYDLCFSPPLPPTVWGELSLCFDVDFPIDTVSSILGVQPTEAKRQRACRWNAYAGTQNPGYWTITFDKTDTFDGDVVQRGVLRHFNEDDLRDGLGVGASPLYLGELLDGLLGG